jgi:hypothetical protein
MNALEPYLALAFAAVWGAYGVVYFKVSSKKRNKEIILTSKPA